MKLFYSATSPFVRKCLVTAQELGLRERVELLPAAPHPVNRDRALVACNPLGKAPALVTDDMQVVSRWRVRWAIWIFDTPRSIGARGVPRRRNGSTCLHGGTPCWRRSHRRLEPRATTPSQIIQSW
jgi:hypothetical protein